MTLTRHLFTQCREIDALQTSNYLRITLFARQPISESRTNLVQLGCHRLLKAYQVVAMHDQIAAGPTPLDFLGRVDPKMNSCSNMMLARDAINGPHGLVKTRMVILLRNAQAAR